MATTTSVLVFGFCNPQLSIGFLTAHLLRHDCVHATTGFPFCVSLHEMLQGQPPVRVLVVDDFEPFRRFVCETLAQNPDLQVIGEASDGLEAVHKAQGLQPALIVLDIGLPTLNGIEAARRIRELSPDSKILFVSEENSAEVAHGVLRLGALGYVVKTHAGSELLAAVETILGGRQFVSSGLAGNKSENS
jgi:DNA-binding NarL/FixJ family response regulator